MPVPVLSYFLDYLLEFGINSDSFVDFGLLSLINCLPLRYWFVCYVLAPRSYVLAAACDAGVVPSV